MAKFSVPLQALSLGQSKEFTDSYKYEFLIQEGDTEIWVPMQEQVLPYMAEELTIGKSFEVYYILAGINKGDWLFLGTEFQ